VSSPTSSWRMLFNLVPIAPSASDRRAMFAGPAPRPPPRKEMFPATAYPLPQEDA